MKRIEILLTLALFLNTGLVHSQNWSTFGGSSGRNGLSKITGPQSAGTNYWSVTSSNLTTLGNAVYTFGDKFVTSRITFAPYKGLIECRHLQNGSLLWQTPFISNSAILYCIGFNEDGVYAHDYDTDTIYAFDVNNGAIKWRSRLTSQTFGAYPGTVFTCNGDLVVNGPGPTGKSTMRLDKYSGDTVWTNVNVYSIGPAVGLAATETTVYRITGAVTAPILLTAIDINTGGTKYYSSNIPGDPDQENPITIGRNGEIYFWRDGGNLFAYEDQGTGFLQSWFYTPQSTTGAAFYGNIGIGPDGNLYVFDTGKIRRIDYTNGSVMDSSIISILQGSISVGNDSTVYVNDQNGNFYALSANLQTVKWQLAVGSNHYCDPALAKDGVMVMTGGGYTITAYKPSVSLKPVADFRVSATKIFAGQAVDFFDQSSYTPTSWQWTFTGALTTSSTAQNPVGIIYANPGVYDVTLVAQNSAGSDTIMKTCYLLVEQATNTENIAPASGLTIFPNPADAFIFCTVPNMKSFNAKCTLYDINGRKALDKTVTARSDIFKIETSTLESGIYFLRLITENKIYQDKIIIRH